MNMWWASSGVWPKLLLLVAVVVVVCFLSVVLFLFGRRARAVLPISTCFCLPPQLHALVCFGCCALTLPSEMFVCLFGGAATNYRVAAQHALHPRTIDSSRCYDMYKQRDKRTAVRSRAVVLLKGHGGFFARCCFACI